MTPFEPAIFLVSTDTSLTQQLISSLLATGGRYQLPLAASVSQACKAFRRVTPTVILLDASAVSTACQDGPLEVAVALLTEFAPVVVVGAPEQQAELACLIASRAVDFVVRVSDFLPVVLGLLERRIRLAEEGAQKNPSRESFMVGPTEDFGEILRHEVNNPLTGILGNAELLLAECKKKNGQPLPIAAIQRLQTIAELAVRLRETVRRLSNAWESQHNHARSS